MIILRQKNYNAFDNVGNSTDVSQVVANKRKVNLNAGLVRFGKKLNQFKTNRKLNQVQKMVNNGKINDAEGSLLAGNIMESYHNKNQQILNKRKAKVGRPINTNPTPIGSGLEAISSTNNTNTTRKNNTNTQQQNNGQGTSILSNLKNTWGGMTNTQKNVARLGMGALAVGATAATVNAIKNRQRRKEEEDARRGGRRGGVVVF